VIGHGDRRHLEGRSLPDQAVDPISAVEQAVLGMNVKVNELGAGHAVLNRRRGGIVSSRAGEVNLTEGVKCDNGRRLPSHAVKMEKNYQISPQPVKSRGILAIRVLSGIKSAFNFR
jgi:hypothetical protein